MIQNPYLTLNRIAVEVNFFGNTPGVHRQFVTDFVNMVYITVNQHKLNTHYGTKTMMLILLVWCTYTICDFFSLYPVCVTAFTAHA